MELTRRDAMSALSALGVSAAVAGCAGEEGRSHEDDADETAIRETMIAAATVLYPDAVDGIEEFVTTFLDSRLTDGDHEAGAAAAVSEMNDRAKTWYDDTFAALDPADRDSLLREMSVDTAEEQPDGTTAERVRYYVVNDLLLALYASPTGGELVGIANPQGYAGGIDSYQRGPQS